MAEPGFQVIFITKRKGKLKFLKLALYYLDHKNKIKYEGEKFIYGYVTFERIRWPCDLYFRHAIDE